MVLLKKSTTLTDKQTMEQQSVSQTRFPEKKLLNPCVRETPIKTSTFANSEDLDVLHHAAFHQGLNCL